MARLHRWAKSIFLTAIVTNFLVDASAIQIVDASNADMSDA